jgi:hypothetical protein
MKSEYRFNNINVEKLLKNYRRYRVARYLLMHPVFRLIALVLGGLLLIIVWPFALMYMAYRTIRFTRKVQKQGSQRFTKNKDIIDL